MSDFAKLCVQKRPESYMYSLSAFLVVVKRAIDKIEEGRLKFDNIKDDEGE